VVRGCLRTPPTRLCTSASRCGRCRPVLPPLRNPLCFSPIACRLQERGVRRALLHVHQSLTKALPYCEHQVKEAEAVGEEVAKAVGDRGSLGVLVEDAKRLAASVDHLRSIVPK
jgi:hypothetical protein